MRLCWSISLTCLSVGNDTFVQWLGLQSEDSTWEDWAELHTTYHLKDKVLLEAVGNDSTQNQKGDFRPKRISKMLGRIYPLGRYS